MTFMFHFMRTTLLFFFLSFSCTIFGQSSCPDPDNYSTVCTTGDCIGGSGDCNFTTTFQTVFTGNNKYANIIIYADGTEVQNTCIGPLSNGTTSYSVMYTAQCDATITGRYIAFTNSSQQNPCGGTSCDEGNCANGQCQSGALPIVLESFNLALVEGQVEIKWVTHGEHNNDHFRIERSTDGLKWEMVTTLSGSQDSDSKIEYLATDGIHLVGHVFYRLIQVDLDGTEHFSAMSFLRIPNARNLIFSVESRQISQLPAAVDAAQIQIYDLMGKLFLKTVLQPGDSRQLDSDMLPGLYTMYVQTGEERYTEKIFVP